jgi:hypothetical protein
VGIKARPHARHQRSETTHTLSQGSAPCSRMEPLRSSWRWSSGYTLVLCSRTCSEVMEFSEVSLWIHRGFIAAY